MAAEPSPDGPFTLAFVGYADPDMADRASAFEDEVLALLADHGARVAYRGRRASAGTGDNAALPLEVHLLWFPDRAALAAYLADDRRRALLDRYGEVFTVKQAFEITEITGTTGAVDITETSGPPAAPAGGQPSSSRRR